MSRPLTARLFTCLGLSAVYLLLSQLLIGFKGEQVFLCLLFSTAYLASAPSRAFIKGFSVFIVYWIIFDYMKAFPNYEYNAVHIESLYRAEKSLFGIHTAQGILTPNEFFVIHHSTFADMLTGVFYLCWVPVPLAFAAWLFFKNRREFYFFSLTFLLVNLLGFVVYYLYPAAPPWYVQQHGFDFLPGTPGNTGGLQRFDAATGTQIFASIYAKSSNVFAAMPSLHSSYPVIVLYYGLRNRLRWVNLFFGVVMLGIWFAAVYNSHHYVLDVLAGVVCAFAGIVVFDRWIKKLNILQRIPAEKPYTAEAI